MNLEQLEAQIRSGLSRRDLNVVVPLLKQHARLAPHSANGCFFQGHVALLQGRLQVAQRAFSDCLRIEPQRLDAALDLAGVMLRLGRNNESFALVQKYQASVIQIPRAAMVAADLMSRLGMHQEAFELFEVASSSQPESFAVKAGLAASATKVGELELAKRLYSELLQQNPDHQRHHYELSRLIAAQDRDHVNLMLEVLARSDQTESVFLHFAIAKELEDLQLWDESFEHYAKGAQIAARKSNEAGYTVKTDIEVFDSAISSFSADWIAQRESIASSNRCPIFIVGLPRSGTTLVERILASHPEVASADETFFLQRAVQRAAGDAHAPPAKQLRLAAERLDSKLAQEYFEALAYRVGDEAYVIDKYPLNVVYLGLIARWIPNAKIVLLERNPMDSCLALFKQPFFSYSFDLDDLAQYYLAYRRMIAHWLEVLPSMHVIYYETLVSNPEPTIDRLLDFLGLPPDPRCYRFYEQKGASATASSVQVREKPHTRSVGKWRHWQTQLAPLQRVFDAADIEY